MLNNVQLMGRFVADPEVFTGENYTVCRFTLAVSRDFKDEDGEYATDFFNVVAWNKFAEFISTHFQKGQLAALDGKLRTRKYMDKKGNQRIATEIAAEHIYFTGNKTTDKDSTDSENTEAPHSSLAESENYADLVNDLNRMSADDDDYPF